MAPVAMARVAIVRGAGRRLPVPQRVPGRGGRDRRPVGQQEVEPAGHLGHVEEADHRSQGLFRGGPGPQLMQRQRPQQRRVDPGVQAEQLQRAQGRRQARRGARPAGQSPVMAEQPVVRAVRRAGRRARLGPRAGVADRGEQRAAARHPGQVGEGGVRPDRARAPVAGRDRVTVGVPADAESVHVHRPAVAHHARCPRLPVQAVRRIDDRRPQGDRRAQVGEVPAHQEVSGVADRAVRKPAKIWRRIG